VTVATLGVTLASEFLPNRMGNAITRAFYKYLAANIPAYELLKKEFCNSHNMTVAELSSSFETTSHFVLRLEKEGCHRAHEADLPAKASLN
jgi:alpha-N-acetylglucosamine transferase